MAPRPPQKIEQVKVDTLNPFPGNPKQHDVEGIRESLRAHGQYKPIIVRRQGRQVLVGHGTLEAAVAEGFATVAVVWRSVKSDDQAARIVAVDNRSQERGGYDQRALATLLGSLEGPEGGDGSVPDLTGTGYEPDDLDKMLASIEKADSPPGEFGRVDGAVTTAYRCPGCGYEWNGRPKPDDGDGDG